MIDIDHLTISFNGVAALDDLSLHVRAGECVLVTGPSGCGKSSLVKVICGLIPHAIQADMEGNVRIAGLEPHAESLDRIAQQVGLVFQNPGSQLFHLHVEDEIAFGPRNLGLPEADVQARVQWALQATGITDLRKCRPSQLSGGQKQIVAIASVLALRRDCWCWTSRPPPWMSPAPAS